VEARLACTALQAAEAVAVAEKAEAIDEDDQKTMDDDQGTGSCGRSARAGRMLRDQVKKPQLVSNSLSAVM
jgi:hypothetical protein